MQVSGWMMRARAEPFSLQRWEEQPGAGEVLVEVAGCGVCHTDLGFYYDGVPTKRSPPLVLGHEISGIVVQAGPGAESWSGRRVVVPAVIPCGTCAACRAGRGSICPSQIFPGNDLHGGFATHVRVPSRGLCPVPELGPGAELADLAVLADAIATPYQALVRSGLQTGDLAVFVGIGGVGGFGVQIAAALGAAVAAIDVDDERLQRIAGFGADCTLSARALDFKGLRKGLAAFAAERGIPSWRTKIFETSGTVAGQATAYGLLGSGGYLGVVGFTAQKLELRLANLMALDATAQGNWGCLPELYPQALELVLQGRIALGPFVERRPLSDIQRAFDQLHQGQVSRRVILVP